MFDDSGNKGYGLSYLGIKPTAAGVAPIAPTPQFAPMGNMPSFNPKMQYNNNPSHVASPMPISQSKSIPIAPMQQFKPFVPPPVQTPAPDVQYNTASPQIDGPMYPALYKATAPSIPMGGIQNGYHQDGIIPSFPQSL